MAAFFLFFVRSSLSELFPLPIWDEELAKLNAIEATLIQSLETLESHASNLVFPNATALLQSALDAQIAKTFPDSTPPPPPQTPAPDPIAVNWSEVPIFLYRTNRSVEPNLKFRFGKKASGFIPEPTDYVGWVVPDPNPVLLFRPLIPHQNRTRAIFIGATQNVTCEVKKGEFRFSKGGKEQAKVVAEIERSAGVTFVKVGSGDAVEFDELAFTPKENYGDGAKYCVPNFILGQSKPSE
jgi:hypothetical protein